MQALNKISVIYDVEINFCLKSLSLSLLKKETISKCLKEQENISSLFSDIGVILHILTNSGNSDISFSLDQENKNMNSPNHLKIYKPDILKGTHIVSRELKNNNH